MRHQAQICFVTGTDTGVGKTVVTAALARNLKNREMTVCAMKPVETGYPTRRHDSDAGRLHAAAGLAEPLRAVSLYRFPEPLAPLEAARRAGVTISLPSIVAAVQGMARRYDTVLIEGAGGLRVPLSSRSDMRDLIVSLRCPVIVVSRTSLGAVNHTLLTLECLQKAGVMVVAVMLNRSCDRRRSPEKQVQSTVRLLKEFCAVPVLGPLPYHSSLDGSWERGLAQLARHPAITALADCLIGNRRRRPLRSSSHRRLERLKK